jgi:hypothetical protein
MAFFLTYVTERGAGYFTVQATDISDAITKVKGAIHDLRCSSATLRRTTESEPSFGTGYIVAAYTPAIGWKTKTDDPE